MNLKELYQEIILEHGKSPRNLTKIDNFNKDAKGNNPLCGDNVHVYLKLNEDKKVEDISFEGSGCAISMASASIMTDLVKGRSENEVKEIINDFLGMIKENPELSSKNLKDAFQEQNDKLFGMKIVTDAGNSEELKAGQIVSPRELREENSRLKRKDAKEVEARDAVAAVGSPVICAHNDIWTRCICCLIKGILECIKV